MDFEEGDRDGDHAVYSLEKVWLVPFFCFCCFCVDFHATPDGWTPAFHEVISSRDALLQLFRIQAEVQESGERI